MNIQKLKNFKKEWDINLKKDDSKLPESMILLIEEYFDNFGTYDELIDSFYFEDNVKELLLNQYNKHIINYLY